MTTTLNAFLGQGIADAVGRPLEFGRTTAKDVRQGITSKVPLYISDDTQMALFGLHGLTNSLNQDGRFPIASIKSAYLDWHTTQTEKYRPGLPGMLAERKLWEREAPGMTCLSSLRALKEGKPLPRSSNGCGTVMRLLPFACYAADTGQWQEATRLAREASLLTHTGNEIEPSTVLYMTVAYSLVEKGESGIAKALAQETRHIEDYGQGWSAASCLNMALWALGGAKTYEDLLMRAIAHGGDSDSVAAVAGGLWGLAGREIPAYLIDRLDERDVIERAVQAFCTSVNP